MGTTPVIRVKGMSRLIYQFEWDKESRHYTYEPKNQKEVDDIFRTQGRLYKRMFFSVLLEEETITLEELKDELKEEIKESKKKATRKAKKSEVKSKHEALKGMTELQAVVED